MSRERIEALAAAGLFLLCCGSCWLLATTSARVEARTAARLEQLQRFEALRGTPAGNRVLGSLSEFDGLFGERSLHCVSTRFGEVLAVTYAGQVP